MCLLAERCCFAVHRVLCNQSFKRRFKSTKGGIRMTRAFRSHNAKSKTPKQRRQLRRTKMLSSGLAKVMRKLGL